MSLNGIHDVSIGEVTWNFIFTIFQGCENSARYKFKKR